MAQQYLYFFPPDFKFLVYDLAPGAGDGIFSESKLTRPMSTVMKSPPFETTHLTSPAEGVDGERGVLRDPAGVEEIAGEYPQAVAALFSLACVGVEYAQLEIRFGGFFGTVEDSVGAESEIAVANFYYVEPFGILGQSAGSSTR